MNDLKIAEKCNIWKQQCRVPIHKHERQCPDCKGQGAFFLNASFKHRCFTIKKCYLCAGEGKVDWIIAITKKPLPDSSGHTFTLSTANNKDIRMKCSGPDKCKKKLKRLWIEKKRFSKNPFYDDYFVPH